MPEVAGPLRRGAPSGAILAAAALLAAACRTPPRRFIIGLYNVEKPADLAVVRQAGFNAVQSYVDDPVRLAPLADEARRQGLATLFNPARLMGSGLKPSRFPAAAWYTADEPDVSKTPPETLKALDEKVHRWAPAQRTAFVVGSGDAAASYAADGDILMVDWYPVPHLPLESAGENVARTVVAAQGKPVWAVLQSMDWRWYRQRDLKAPRVGRFPDMAEIRFMSYHALVEGAHGLWYFAFTTPDGRTLLDFPAYWFALEQVVHEMAELAPIIERGSPMDAAPLGITPGLLSEGWRRDLRDYLVVLNPSNAPVEAPKSIFSLYWRPLFEPRRYVGELLLQKAGRLYFKPYQVLVFESRLSAKSRLRPRT